MRHLEQLQIHEIAALLGAVGCRPAPPDAPTEPWDGTCGWTRLSSNASTACAPRSAIASAISASSGSNGLRT